MATNGLVVMTPTSIAYSGTSASINADGSVDFSAVTSLSLNGVFTSAYDNYMIALRSSSSGSVSIFCRLRSSGTDNTTSNSYVSQYLSANGTTISPARHTDTGGWVSQSYSLRSGFTSFVFGPYLSQPTAARSITAIDNSDASIYDVAFTHNQSASYDGITFYSYSAPNLTGLVTVFGFNQ